MPADQRKIHTRALLQGLLDNSGRVVIGAGLLGAVADAVRVVVALAQAGHVTGVALQLGGLVVHVVDAHLLHREPMLEIFR